MQTFKKIHIANMHSICCQRVVQMDFEQNNIQVIEIKPNCVEISFDSNTINLDKIAEILKRSDMTLIVSREQLIVEDIKKAIYELIYEMNNIDSIVRKSEYLVEKLGKSYQQLSKLFSKYEDTTLEKFTIHHKIQRIKELILSDEYSLNEIAYMMDYSSVQYLSNQFKKETGITVSDFKKELMF